jgi:hypothetical protein
VIDHRAVRLRGRATDARPSPKPPSARPNVVVESDQRRRDGSLAWCALAAAATVNDDLFANEIVPVTVVAADYPVVV